MRFDGIYNWYDKRQARIKCVCRFLRQCAASNSACGCEPHQIRRSIWLSFAWLSLPAGSFRNTILTLKWEIKVLINLFQKIDCGHLCRCVLAATFFVTAIKQPCLWFLRQRLRSLSAESEISNYKANFCRSAAAPGSPFWRLANCVTFVTVDKLIIMKSHIAKYIANTA